MIRVDETDPVGELEPSFPYRDVTVRRGADFKDHYEVQSEIGRGKFGTVYRCKEKTSNLSLAAKVVNTMKKEDRRAVEREVEIMRRLQHPRLIQLYDAIDTGKQIYVILELIEGGELFERVIDDDFVLTERSCAVFMRQICEGIEFIHAQNILHLDLKPENILCLTKEGNRIKIIDFGLARQYDPNKKLQVLFGTPEFVAPEVVNFDQIGFGTDMWSIGVICYVLLSGLSPFMGDTDIETMANVTIAKYDFDHDAFTDLSEDAKDFIKRLLLKDKENRASATQCREHQWLVRKEEGQVDKERLVSYKVSKNLTKIAEDSSFWQVSPRVNDKEELDVAKENLRIFVERWREHPDSPYTIEMSYTPHISRPSEIEESTSLHGPSPSPRESLCSTPSESGITTINGAQGSAEVEKLSRENNEFFLGVPNIGLALERRASEGISTREKPRDAASQIVLAEEIIKLSDHLRAIVTNTSSCVDVSPNEKAAGVAESPSKKKVNKIAVPSLMDKPKQNEITEKLSSIIRRRKINGTTFYGNRNIDRSTYTETFTDNASTSGSKDENTSNIGKSFTPKPIDELAFKPKVLIDDRNYEESRVFYAPTEDSDMDLTPPWRRTRVKRSFGETSRDVPRISNLHDLHKSLNLDEPTNTKDLLLQLLGEWDETSSSRTSGIGRNSVSVDWYGEESIARKTMNSLAEYFQSKQRTGQPQVNF